MQLINEYYKGVDITNEENFPCYYFEYNVKEADFFLKLSNYWFKEDEPQYWYNLDIGGHKVTLPENSYIMLADVYGIYVDWVKVGELHGRELCTALYFSSLYADQWSIEEIRIDSVDEDKRPVNLPKTKNLMPVKVGRNRMVFISHNDCYVKTKKMNFSCLY